MMKLTILGASPACQNPGGACSGYLVEQDGIAVLLDCGSGVFSRLQQYVKPEEVRAIVLSHMHADHSLDLIQYRYYLSFSGARRQGVAQPGLYFPPEGQAKMLVVSSMQDASGEFFSAVFATHEYDPGRKLEIGPLVIEFVAVKHTLHSYGMRISGDGLLAFSGDTGPCESLVDLARDADVFLCECANPANSDYAFHLTPEQAGSVAQEAGARRLVLTHRWAVDGRDSAVVEAGRAFQGSVTMAREDMQIVIGGSPAGAP
jgi:ribonuclease BN (tRNA processing enzyme)